MRSRTAPTTISIHLTVSQIDRLVDLIDTQGGEGALTDTDEFLRATLDGARVNLSGAQARALERAEEKRAREVRNELARPSLRARSGGAL